MSEKLEQLNAMVKERVLTEGAAPIVGLVEIENSANFLPLFVSYLDGERENLRSAFKIYPFASSWVVTQILRKRYGEEGLPTVHPIICEELRIPQSPTTSKILEVGFNSICRRIGVQIEQLRGPVKKMHSQTGVPQNMLHHLAESFLRQERYYGTPPTENSHELNLWEDNALEFLPDTVKTPRYSIRVDDTGWHANLFARLCRIEKTDETFSEFEKAFHKAIRENQTSGRLGSRGQTAGPKPKLNWKFDSIVLDVPKLEGRMKYWTDSNDKKNLLAGGKSWTVSPPWPKRMYWMVGDDSFGEIPFLNEEASIAIFDKNSGYFLNQFVVGDKTVIIDAANLIIVSRSKFKINDEDCYALREGAYIATSCLDAKECKILLGGQELKLIQKKSRRITPVGDAMANGPDGALYGHITKFSVDTAQSFSTKLNLLLSGNNSSAEVCVDLDEFGKAELEVHKLLNLLNSESGSPIIEPFRLKIGLRPIVSDEIVQSGTFWSSFWIWPETTLSKDGSRFICTKIPTNLETDRCLNIHTKEGSVCLDKGGAYDKARVCLFIDGKFVNFDIPNPDVTCTHQNLNGEIKYIGHGSQIVLRPEENFSTITIRSPDRKAELTVRGRTVSNPFQFTKSYSIMILDLIDQSSDSKVIYSTPSGKRIELFRVVESTTPEYFKQTQKGNELIIHIEVREPIDAISLSIEDDKGDKSPVEFEFRKRNVEDRPPDWFSAEMSTKNGNLFVIKIDQSQLPKGNYLMQFNTRPDGKNMWNKLSDDKGLAFVSILQGKLTEESSIEPPLFSQQFRTLSKWLSYQVAGVTLQQMLKLLIPVWKKIGLSLSKTSQGRKELLISSLLEAEENTSSSWIPTFHPLIFYPELYGSSAEEFAIFSTQDDSSIANLAAVDSITSGRLREKEYLSHVAMMSFKNREDADKLGVPLEGFDPKLYFMLFTHEQIDSDKTAGSFWRNSPVLGPEHWRAAHLQLVERINSTSLFDADKNRWKRINLLITRCYNIADLKPTVPKRNHSDENVTDVDVWISATICDFARAARNRSVSNWVKELANRLEVEREMVLEDVGYLIRLAPELFAFYMILWQLTLRDKEENHD